ncbi:hypothetical protein [Actinoplanes sp. NPDC049265]|uniref:hypothetical protein n=1 Tax=Actinoplanes sp. NPDC049265 TaxID=3363902 RepID=UPI003717A2D5
MNGQPASDELRREVLQLCQAVHESIDLMGLDAADMRELERRLVSVEQLANAPDVLAADLTETLKGVRYLLVEVAQCPLGAFMAASAETIIGDGYGRLFF